MRLFFLATLLPVVLSCSSRFYCPPQPATEEEQEAIFREWYQTFFMDRDIPAAYHRFVAENYIQHGPYGSNGREANMLFVLDYLDNVANFTPITMAFGGGHGWIHQKMVLKDRPRPISVMQHVRYEGTCLMEHWEVLQELPEDAPNPIAMF
ncbi:hypothetical protein F66182_6962 [Fusarium sp. NRRL 66182]|nr:hypothetical protein F66182_6962 [Fusarium sp. NRRL 66182]